ncbi:MAG TPA: hypothetical protein VMU07_02490 [Candidatus Paceibacterota bacterium]|nr:hypothetical protein [Candidatus Paceibacterota bacterium]
MHKASSVVMAIGMAFFGTFILALWVPGYHSLETATIKALARERIRTGILLYGFAVGSLVFGLYLTGTMMGAIVVYLGYCILKGIVIAFSRSNG